jgi:hypothetical protein
MEENINYELCGDIFDNYKITMNDLSLKNGIMLQIFNEKNWDKLIGAKYIGSYMSFPEDIKRATKLDQYYRDAKLKKTVDATFMEEVVTKLRIDKKKPMSDINCEYICFILGAINSNDDVSHHIGFIYKKSTKTIKKYDPGMRSWAPELGEIVFKIIIDVFGDDINFLTSYTHKNTGCGFCQPSLKGPQDTCRGGKYIGEGAAFLSGLAGHLVTSLGHKALHRETFCQTWSLILILNELQLIQSNNVNYEFENELYQDWSKMDKRSLEICIRRFMLWIVYKFDRIFEETWKILDKKNKNYKKIFLSCMKNFDESIEVPTPGESMCTAISLTTISNKTKRKR